MYFISLFNYNYCFLTRVSMEVRRIRMMLTKVYADFSVSSVLFVNIPFFFVLYFNETSIWRNLDLIEYCFYILYESHFLFSEPDQLVDNSGLVVMPTLYLIEFSRLFGSIVLVNDDLYNYKPSLTVSVCV